MGLVLYIMKRLCTIQYKSKYIIYCIHIRIFISYNQKIGKQEILSSHINQLMSEKFNLINLSSEHLSLLVTLITYFLYMATKLKKILISYSPIYLPANILSLREVVQVNLLWQFFVIVLISIFFYQLIFNSSFSNFISSNTVIYIFVCLINFKSINAQLLLILNIQMTF